MPKALIYKNFRIYLPQGNIPELKDVPQKEIERITQFHLGDYVAISGENFDEDHDDFVSLRQILDDHPPKTSEALIRGMQLSHWDRLSRHCGICGAETQLVTNTNAKICSSCGHNLYPSIQPVAIVLIKRGNELLLAKGLPPRKHHSCLAGFVEVGESVEECLHREVKEEVGIEIQNLNYFGSQVWPFPSNLMLGFTADYKSGDLVLDENEITDARWFTQDSPPEVIPPQVSIARQMIDSVWS